MISSWGIAGEHGEILFSQSLYPQHDAFLPFLEAFQGHVLHVIHRLKAVLRAELCHLGMRIIFMGLLRQRSFAMQRASELWP
jgi:hypothetical protein